jgi:hypothetical protein
LIRKRHTVTVDVPNHIEREARSVAAETDRRYLDVVLDMVEIEVV